MSMLKLSLTHFDYLDKTAYNNRMFYMGFVFLFQNTNKTKQNP